MKDVVRGCGKIIMDADTDQIAANTKSSFRDLVTAYDVRVQEYAISRLSECFPEARFVSEEKDDADPSESCSQSMTFVIDPIDGTANFVHHFRHSCTSIACVIDGEPAAAVIFNPYAEELFSAEKGKGAYLNDRQIHVAQEPLSGSLALVGSSPYYLEKTEETFQNIRKVFGRCQDIRRSGSAALDLCYVAAGRAGLFFESVLSVWDYAAGALIVKEAGGECCSYTNEPLIFDRPVKSSVIAAGAEILDECGIMVCVK